MNKIKLAMLGVAHPHSDLWLKAWKTLPYAEVVGVWDPEIERGKAWSEKYDVPYFENLEDILDKNKIDAVGICSENNLHAQLTIKSAEAGIDILCEKPMATTLADCDRMMEAIQKSGVRYMQAFPMREDPSNQKVKDWLDEGVIGQVSSIRKRHGIGWAVKKPIPSGLEWFIDAEKNGGGAFLDEGVHGADFLQWLFGKPVSVTAVIDTISTDIPVDDHGVAIYKFQNGVVGILQSAWTWQAGTNTTEIFGNEGTIIQQFTDSASTTVMGETSMPLQMYSRLKQERGWIFPKLPIPFKHIHERVAMRFVDCLVSGQKFPASFEDGKTALEMILKAMESAKQEKTIYF